MTLLRERLETVARRLPEWSIPLVLIVVVVLAGNAMYVLRLANDNPISWTAGISHTLCRVTCGRPAIDPNVGFVTQPLGHLAAMDILHGHLPFWNSFEGLGQPLLGEMQSAALFPLTLLFAFSSGLLWFHVVLEVIAGISTYFLARRLSMPVFIATTAAMVFSLNGTYAWLGNAVLNPVAFLPMLLLGIEMIFDSTKSATQRGWYVAALALALSILAGFPEVAYLDGVFAGAWAIVRLFSIAPDRRWRALRRLGLGALVGVVIALPVLVPFEDFLKVAFIGSHTSAVDGVSRLPGYAVSMFTNPYVYGTIFSNTNVANAWAGIGGYLDTGACVLALVGLAGRRFRPLRILLGVWVIAGLAGAIDFWHSRVIWNLIPLVDTSSFPRYIMPSCEMAVVVLAGLGLWDLTQQARARRLFVTAGVAMTLLTVWLVLAAGPYNKGVVLTHRNDVILLGLHLLPFIALGLLLILAFLTKFRVTPWLIAIVLVGEAVVLFFVPTAESPKQVTIDYGPIHYLKAHQGEGRFLDLAVLYPNWGTEFGLNEFSAIDLPFPRSFKNFLEDQIYPGLTPGNQFTVKGGLIGIEALEGELAKHFKAYEDASVKYVLANSSVALSSALVKDGLTPVYHDSLATIYQMPDPRHFYSTSSSACTVSSSSVNVATVHCATSGATLLRTELSMKGWRATINGKSATITTVDGVYQRVALPEGTSTVQFSFTPPHERGALVLGALGALFLLGSVVNERHRFVPRRRAKDYPDIP